MAKNTNYVVNVSSSEFKKLLEIQQQSLTQLSAIKTLTELSRKLDEDSFKEVKEQKVVDNDQLKATKEVSTNIKDLIELTKESSKNIAKMVQDKAHGTVGESIRAKFDAKFGSLRNVLDTMGVVKKGGGGVFDNALKRREADKTFIKGDMKLSGTSEQEARNKLTQIKEHEKNITHNEKEISKYTKLGISEEQLSKTIHGKTLLENRNSEVNKLSKIDYRVQQHLNTTNESNKKQVNATNESSTNLNRVNATNVNENINVNKKIVPIGNTPLSVIKAANPAIKTDELELEAIRREEEQSELLKRIAENTGGKEKFKSPQKPEEEGGGLLNGIGFAVGAIAGLAYGYFKTWLKVVKGLFEGITKVLKGAYELLLPESLRNNISESFSKIGKFFSELGNKAKALFVFEEGSAIGKALAAVKSGFSSIGGVLSKIGEGISGAVKAIAKIPGIGAFLRGAGLGFSMFFGLGELIGTIMLISDTIEGAFKGWEKGGFVGAINGALQGLIGGFVGGLADLIKSASSWILGALGFTDAEKFLDSFKFTDIINNLIDGFFKPFQMLQDALMHPIDSLMKLGTLVTDAFSKIGEVFKPVTDFFKSIGDSVINMLEGIGIPEIGFTIPIIGKKVSIGPFYPFKKDSEKPIAAGNSTAGAGQGSAEFAAKDPRRVDSGASPASTSPIKSTGSKEEYTQIAGEKVVPGQPLSGKQMAVMAMSLSVGNKYPAEIMQQYNKQLAGGATVDNSKANAITPTPSSGNIIAGKSTEVVGAKEDMANKGGNTNAILNAPTTVNNNTNQSTIMRSPFKNEDSTLNKYIGTRYAAY